MFKWADTKTLIHMLQGDDWKMCISLNIAWLLRETVHDFTGKGKVLYAALLDIKRAYVAYWHSIQAFSCRALRKGMANDF